MEKSKYYYCDEGLEEFQDWFCDNIWSLCGIEILENVKNFPWMLSLLKQAVVTKRMVEERVQFALPKSDTDIEQTRKRAFQRKFA